jgi:homoserine kinase
MANQSVLVRVPATVGNFGGATNCAALALDAPLNVKVTPRSDGQVAIRYFGEHGERVPRDRSNLVIRAMEAALNFRELRFTGADLEIFSSVPVAVGLGSSTAAILAGLIAADQIYRLNLEEKTLLDLAASYEARHDNLRAAWLGGFVACAGGDSGLTYHRTDIQANFSLHIVVPETELVLSAEREAPLAREAHAENLDRARMIGDFLAEPEKGHGNALAELLPPTCEKDVAGLKEALEVRMPGILSVFVCGTGPTVGILAQENAREAVAAVRECFARHGVGSSSAELRPTNNGARDWNAVLPDVTLPAWGGRSKSLAKSTHIPA